MFNAWQARVIRNSVKMNKFHTCIYLFHSHVEQILLSFQ